MWKSGERASFTLDGWGGCECGPIALVANVAPVGSAFVWHDWRPFLVVGSRVGGVGEIAGGQGDWAKSRGFYAPFPHSVRPHFSISFAGCSGGFCFWREGVGQGSGERSHMASVLFLHSFSKFTANAPR